MSKVDISRCYLGLGGCSHVKVGSGMVSKISKILRSSQSLIERHFTVISCELRFFLVI